MWMWFTLMCFDLFWLPWGYTRELESINKERPSPLSQMIITNITIDLTIDASLIVSCSYLFNSISGMWMCRPCAAGKHKGWLVEGKTHIKIPLKTLKQQGLLSFPSKGECLVMICSWGWKAQAEWQFRSRQHRMIL